jgi:hypothetical protein
MPRDGNSIVNKNTWVFWVISAAVGIIWLFIGQKRSENIWIRYAFNVSWSAVIAFAVIIG